MGRIDLTGQRFGRLEVLHETERKGKGKDRYWRCLCDCGEYTSVNQNNLRRGVTKSCGCLSKENMSAIGNEYRQLDIKDEKFGKLTAVKRTRKTDDGTKWLWLCRCDCGNEREVTTGELRNMMVTSCGCSNFTRERYGTNEEILNNLIAIHKECGRLSRAELVKKLNKNIFYLHHRFKIYSVVELWGLVEKRIEISEEFPQVNNLIGLQFRRLFVIDKVDNIDGRTAWKCLCNCGNERDVKGINLTEKQVQSCGCLKKDKDTRNLRKQYDKKRVDGVAKQLFKDKDPRKDSSTGYRGVAKYYTKGGGKLRYRAWITVKGKQYYKSGFLTPEEAYYKGRLELEKKHLPWKDEK